MKTTYIKTQLQNLVNVSKIVTIHYYEFDKNFVFEGEKHDFWEMVYTDKGNVQICRDNETIELSQGELIFHKPNEFHSIKALNSSINLCVISFECNSPAMIYFERYHTVLDKELKPFLASILKESENTYAIPKNDPLLKKLTKKENATIGGEQLIKTYLEQLLILLIRKITKTGKTEVFPSKESMENHLVVKVKSFISETLESPFRIDKLCLKLGYSKSYLSKIFFELTNMTIANYAVKKKIDKAKQLIRENNLNFAQIADQLSFYNPQYFSRVFKRVTNMTPTEFKLSLQYKN